MDKDIQKELMDVYKEFTSSGCNDRGAASRLTLAYATIKASKTVRDIIVQVDREVNVRADVDIHD